MVAPQTSLCLVRNRHRGDPLRDNLSHMGTGSELIMDGQFKLCRISLKILCLMDLVSTRWLIIEDSSGVRFALYCLRYNGIEKELEEANLSEETGNWANVDDFRWLRAVQSPNWSVFPEDERVHMIDN
ncbi:hypothetical protein ACH5RR_013168 [Cinchona calisaya]|uniref:C-CAP/cofactor C-like domain-containing protein n=1 Tax=Cinchona calisaya TaxID=153742 RepID=A0ABD2ZZA6_9GENT